jgi:glycosyltransferase involved in cell wall biosynthesis
VYNPIDFARFSPEMPRGRTDDLNGVEVGAPLIGVIGQITPWKGQIDAIRALPYVRQHVADATLVVVGDPLFVARGTRYDNRRYERALRSEVRRLQLDRAVIFLGGREDVPALLQSFDVLAMPSWEEPFGRVAVEAMSMNVPVVATRIGGPPEYITHGTSGLLIPPHNPVALAGALVTLLVDDARRLAMAAAGRAAVRTRFTVSRYVELVLGAFQNALTDRDV